MARREVTQFYDDLDNSPLSPEEVHVIRFSTDGNDYVLDLSADNAQAFRDALAPFLEAARPVTAGSRRNVSPAAIRSWAREAGYTVAQRGKIPNEIIDAYHEAKA